MLNKTELLKEHPRISMQYFTLLEVILAIAIFMLVSSIAIISLISTEKTLRKVTAVDKRLESCQLIDRIVNRAFKNAVNFTWQDTNLHQQLVFMGKKDQILICYLHRIDTVKFSGLRFLKLFLEDNNLIAEYSNLPMEAWEDNPTGTTHEIIASGIKVLSFSYINIDRESKQLTILNSWDNKNMPYIPLGIQLEIEWENNRKDVWFRRTAGAGYQQQLGRR